MITRFFYLQTLFTTRENRHVDVNCWSL